MPMPMDTEISHDFHNHIQWPPGFQQQRDVAGFSTTKSYGQEAMTGLDENRGGEEESLLLNAAAGPSLLQYLSMPASGTRPNEYMSFDDDHSKNSGFQDPMFSGPAITAAASVGPNDQVYDPSVPRAFPTTPPQFGDCQSIDSIGKSLGLDHHDIIDHDGGIMNVPFGSHWDHVTVATGLHDFRQNSPPSAADAPSSPYSGSAFSSPTELDFTPDNASAITAPTPTANANTITGSTGEDAFSKYASIDAVTASSELFHTPPNSSLFPVANRFTPDIVSELDDDATPYVDYGHGGAPESAALAVSDDLQYQYQYQTEQEQLTPSPENDADVRHVEDVSEMEALTISAADMEALSTIPWTNTPMMIWENPSTALATDSREQAGKENHDTAIGMHATAAAAGAANEDDDDGFISDSAIFDRHGSVKNCLPPALPHGHDHNKYLLVIDTQNGRRMRIKGTLQNTDIGEIPDSYCKANAVFPRSWRPRHGPVGDEEFGSEDATNDTDRKTPNKSSEEPFTILPLLHRPKGGRWYKVSDTIDSASGVIHPSLSSHDIYQQVPDGPYPKNDPAEKATNGVISVLLANGKWTEFNIPRPRKRRTECALNELGYRMSWTASRALSKRPLFLQRACEIPFPLVSPFSFPTRLSRVSNTCFFFSLDQWISIAKKCASRWEEQAFR